MPGRGHRIIPEICLPSHAPESPSAAAPAPASFGLVEAAVHHVCDLFPSPVLSIVQEEGAPREETAARSHSEGKGPPHTRCHGTACAPSSSARARTRAARSPIAARRAHS